MTTLRRHRSITGGYHKRLLEEQAQAAARSDVVNQAAQHWTGGKRSTSGKRRPSHNLARDRNPHVNGHTTVNLIISARARRGTVSESSPPRG